MAAIIGILALIAAIVSLVFFIQVLIKLFKAKGALHGILGIFCSLYTFIWGWINADAQGLKKTMVNWTITIVVMIILQVIGGVLGAGAIQTPAIEP